LKVRGGLKSQGETHDRGSLRPARKGGVRFESGALRA
jgi:hypothetical protein